MLVVQVRDIIRHSIFRVEIQPDTNLTFKQKILLRGPRESVVAEVMQTAKDIPNVKVHEDYKYDRVLSEEEINKFAESQHGEIERLHQIQAEADRLKLDMRFFASRIGWQGKVYSFLFTSHQPVDFRELLKTVTQMFPGRIHLQRLDPRDRAEIMGGVGACAYLNCCTTLRVKQEKVSLDAVRDQGIMIKGNQKIYDPSGKLKSCLLYELPLYREYRKYLPHMRQEVRFGEQKARVIGLDILNGRVKIQFNDTDGIDFVSVNDVDYPNKQKFPDHPLEVKIPELALDGDLEW